MLRYSILGSDGWLDGWTNCIKLYRRFLIIIFINFKLNSENKHNNQPFKSNRIESSRIESNNQLKKTDAKSDDRRIQISNLLTPTRLLTLISLSAFLDGDRSERSEILFACWSNYRSVRCRPGLAWPGSVLRIR